MSNQNAGADKKRCRRAWANTIAFWASHLSEPERIFGPPHVQAELRALAVAGSHVLSALMMDVPCDCHECTRQHSTGWKTWRDAT
jgi:hypothetical protein